MNIYIDIETFAGNTKPQIGEIEAPSNYKDEAKIKAYKEEALDKEYRKQALDVLQCQVVCIGYAIDDGEVKTIVGKDEKEVMQKFELAIADIPQRNLDTMNWVAHNGLSFDYPILWHRMKKYKLPDVFPPQTYLGKSGQLMDTMKMAGFTDYKSMLSLKKLAKFYGIGDKSGKATDVHDLFLAGKYDEIAEYCKGDVELLRKLYYILK